MNCLRFYKHNRVQESHSPPSQAHWNSPSPSPIGISPLHPTPSTFISPSLSNHQSPTSVNRHQETSPPSLSSPPTSSIPPSTCFIWELLTTPRLFPSVSPSTQHHPPHHLQMERTAQLFSHWVFLPLLLHSIMILISPSPSLVVEEMEEVHHWEGMEEGTAIYWHCCHCWCCWLFLHSSSLLEWWCFLMFTSFAARKERRLLEWWRVILCDWNKYSILILITKV